MNCPHESHFQIEARESFPDKDPLADKDMREKLYFPDPLNDKEYVMEIMIPELRQNLKDQDFKCGTEEPASISVLPLEADAIKETINASNKTVEEVSWGNSTVNMEYERPSDQNIKILKRVSFKDSSVSIAADDYDFDEIEELRLEEAIKRERAMVKALTRKGTQYGKGNTARVPIIPAKMMPKSSAQEDEISSSSEEEGVQKELGNSMVGKSSDTDLLRRDTADRSPSMGLPPPGTVDGSPSLGLSPHGTADNCNEDKASNETSGEKESTATDAKNSTKPISSQSKEMDDAKVVNKKINCKSNDDNNSTTT